MAKAADISKTLDRALAKLNAGDHEAALEALLIAWRAKRLARIANIIDRVSDVVTERRGGAIKGKSVKDRTEKWLSKAKKKDSCDVGSLLSTPWPGTWEPAMPVIGAIAKFPDDPRIAMALARIVDETPYDTWTSHRFYQPLFTCLNKQLDLRTLPTLVLQIDRTDRSTYWKRSTKRLEIAAVTKLETYQKTPTKLTAAEEKSLLALEALYASAASAEKSDAKNEASFLKAIYESPDDDSLRAVFADWLTEHNDPRGEFISLQLARSEGRISAASTGDDTLTALSASLKREASLLKKHAKAWAGPLDRLIQEEGREFERGFLSGGMIDLADRYPKQPPQIEAFSDPAWSTLRSFTLTRRAQSEEGLGAAFVNLPSMKWLRVARDLEEFTLADLVLGPVRERFDEIDFRVLCLDDEDAEAEPERAAKIEAAREVIAAKAHLTFPNVKALSLEGNINSLEWVLSSPIGKCAERITLNNYSYPLVDLIALVDRLRLPVKELVFARSNRRNSADWRFVVTRDASDGRFTKIHGGAVGVSSIPSHYGLDGVLDQLGPDQLTELTIEKARVCNYDESAIRTIEGHLAKFTRLSRIEVPWERVASAQSEAAAAKGSKTALTVRLEGKRFSTKKDIVKLWDLIHEAPLSLAVDSYSVNNGKHTALPEAKVESAASSEMCEHIVEVLNRVRTNSIELYRKGASETCSVNIQMMKRYGRNEETLAITCAYEPDDPNFVEMYTAWLVRVLESLNVEQGQIDFVSLPEEEAEDETSEKKKDDENGDGDGDEDGDNDDDNDNDNDDESIPILEPLRYSPSYGWISILGAKHEKYLSFDAISKLGGSKDLESLRVLRTARNAILVTSAKPSIMRAERSFLLAYQVGLCNARWQSLKESWKTTPRAVLLEVLSPALKKLGFAPADLDPLETARGDIYFISREAASGKGARAIYIAPWNVMAEPTYSISKRHAPNDKDADLTKENPPRERRIDGSNGYSHPASTEKQLRGSLSTVLGKLDEEMVWFENKPEEKPAGRRRR